MTHRDVIMTHYTPLFIFVMHILIANFLLHRFTDEEIQAKVDAYRNKLMGTNSQNGNETTKDGHGRPM